MTIKSAYLAWACPWCCLWNGWRSPGSRGVVGSWDWRCYAGADTISFCPGSCGRPCTRSWRAATEIPSSALGSLSLESCCVAGWSQLARANAQLAAVRQTAETERARAEVLQAQLVALMRDREANKVVAQSNVQWLQVEAQKAEHELKRSRLEVFALQEEVRRLSIELEVSSSKQCQQETHFLPVVSVGLCWASPVLPMVSINLSTKPGKIWKTRLSRKTGTRGSAQPSTHWDV